MKKPILLMIPIEKLEKLKIQPEGRTTNKALNILAQMIKLTGIYLPAVVSKKIIADGHRRIAVAKKNGETKFPCLIYDNESAEMLFNCLNSGIRNSLGKEWFESWAKSSNPEENIKTNRHGKSIKQCKYIFGERRAIEIGKRRLCSPSISNAIYAVDRMFKEVDIDPTPSLQIIGEWIIKFEAQNLTKTFRLNNEDKTDFITKVQNLSRCIIEGKPYSKNQKLKVVRNIQKSRDEFIKRELENASRHT